MMKKLLLAVLSTILAVQITAGAALADPGSGQASKSLFDMPLEDVLQMQVSTASKLSGSADMAPGNLVVITQEQIRRYGYRTIGDAVERAVGFLHNDLGFTSFMAYRGLTPGGFTSDSRILYLIDGLRLNEWQYDTAFTNEDFPIDIESVDRIEVLKGAGSAVWGTNALYAVVNVISKDADSDRNRQVMAEYASESRGKGYASFGHETEGGLKVFGGVSYTNLDGDISAYYPSYDEPDFNNGIAKGPFEQWAFRGSLKVAYENFYTNFLYAQQNTFLTSDVDYLIGDGGTSDFETEPIRVEAGYKWELWAEQQGELLLRTYYSRDEYHGEFRYPLGEELARDRYHNTSDSAGGELRYTMNLTDKIRALAGFELVRVYDSVLRNNYIEFAPAMEEDPVFSDSYRQSFDRTVQSYFFDFVYSPIDRLSFFLGGRFDKPTDLSTAFGPRASIVGKPWESTTMKLLYSRGFRNPSIGESLVYEPEPQSLDPEELNFYEFLVEQQVGESLTLTGSVFYNDLSDSIGFYLFEGGNGYYTNFRGFTSKGVELEAKARLDESLQGYLNFTYATAEDKETDSKFRTVPSYLARAGLSWSYPEWFIVSPELVYGSSSKTFDGYKFDDYLIANLTVLSYPVVTGASLSASVYNIFDNDYVRVFGGSEDGQRAMENGREFRLQATWQF